MPTKSRNKTSFVKFLLTFGFKVQFIVEDIIYLYIIPHKNRIYMTH